MPSRVAVLLLARALLALFVFLGAVACVTDCAGPVRAVEGAIRVDSSHCKESAEHAGDPEIALLDCVSGGEASVRVELGRREWQALKARTAPAPFEAGPGK